MELVFVGLAFLSGLVFGSGLFVLGICVGRFIDSGTFRLAPEKGEETPEIVDDDYFERARLGPDEGGHEFPTDAELERLHRHSQY